MSQRKLQPSHSPDEVMQGSSLIEYVCGYVNEAVEYMLSSKLTEDPKLLPVYPPSPQCGTHYFSLVVSKLHTLFFLTITLSLPSPNHYHHLIRRVLAGRCLPFSVRPS